MCGNVSVACYGDSSVRYELYETTKEDVEMKRDFFSPLPKVELQRGSGYNEIVTEGRSRFAHFGCHMIQASE